MKIRDLWFCLCFYFKVLSLTSIRCCGFLIDMADYFMETETCPLFLLLQMFFPFPSQECSQILRFFAYVPPVFQHKAAVPRQEKTTPSQAFVCNSLGSVRIMQKMRMIEVSAWSLTGGNCGIQGERKIPETKKQSGVQEGGSVLVKDPSTAYKYHPSQGPGQCQTAELQVRGLGRHGTDVFCLPLEHHMRMDGELIGDQGGQQPSGPSSHSFYQVHSGIFSRTCGTEDHYQ